MFTCPYSCNYAKMRVGGSSQMILFILIHSYGYGLLCQTTGHWQQLAAARKKAAMMWIMDILNPIFFSLRKEQVIDNKKSKIRY